MLQHKTGCTKFSAYRAIRVAMDEGLKLNRFLSPLRGASRGRKPFIYHLAGRKVTDAEVKKLLRAGPAPRPPGASKASGAVKIVVPAVENNFLEQLLAGMFENLANPSGKRTYAKRKKPVARPRPVTTVQADVPVTPTREPGTITVVAPSPKEIREDKKKLALGMLRAGKSVTRAAAVAQLSWHTVDALKKKLERE
jgi:hypothetical protein